jgi:hypothetical protein
MGVTEEWSIKIKTSSIWNAQYVIPYGGSSSFAKDTGTQSDEMTKQNVTAIITFYGLLLKNTSLQDG